MKILQLTPRLAFPPDDGGKISIANVTRHLSDFGADLTVLTFAEQERDVQHLKLGERDVELHTICHSTRNSIARIWNSLWDSEPLYLRKHFSAQVAKLTCQLVESKSFDLIHADHTAMAPLAVYLKQKYDIPVGLRLHNIEWKIWQRYADRLSDTPLRFAEKLYVQTQALKLKKRESELLKEVDIAFPITEVDLNEAKQLAPQTAMLYAGGGVNPDEWTAPKNTIRSQHEILLASTWSWVHNQDGALWFLNKILPLIRQSIPDVKVVIVGRDIPDSMKSFEGTSVECKGYVNSVQQYFHHASVFVAPLFVGSGVRIKILEAMAAGLPIVATEVAAEGIDANEEHGLFVTNNIAKQVDIITTLLNDPVRVYSCGESATARIAELYTWKDQIHKMYVAYTELIGEI